MKIIVAIAASVMLAALAGNGYAAGFERIHSDYESDLFEDAKAPVNSKFTDANTKAQLKRGKVKETEGSIGGITIEKGANVFGPIGTSVDTKGGDITVIGNEKSKGK
jgi:hypothetical protein